VPAFSFVPAWRGRSPHSSFAATFAARHRRGRTPAGASRKRMEGDEVKENTLTRSRTLAMSALRWDRCHARPASRADTEGR
jgi:hypothetical protein